MKKVICLVIFLLTLQGCASTGVVMMDKGTYMIGKRSAQLGCGPPVAIKADVYTEANEFCAKEGRSVETIKLDIANSLPARPGSVSLEFRCIAK